MDEIFIQALITQALAAYNKGGPEALAQWKQHLPLPHREQFERDCGARLQEAIDPPAEHLQEDPTDKEAAWTLEQWQNFKPKKISSKDCTHENVMPRTKTELVSSGYICADCGIVLEKKPEPPAEDPRKKHTRDRRRTKPL